MAHMGFHVCVGRSPKEGSQQGREDPNYNQGVRGFRFRFMLISQTSYE